MKKKLEAELISIAHRILRLGDKSTLPILQQEAKNLYEKLTILSFAESHFTGPQPTIGQIQSVFEEETIEIESQEATSSPELKADNHEVINEDTTLNIVAETSVEVLEEETELEDVAQDVLDEVTIESDALEAQDDSSYIRTTTDIAETSIEVLEEEIKEIEEVSDDILEETTIESDLLEAKDNISDTNTSTYVAEINVDVSEEEIKEIELENVEDEVNEEIIFQSHQSNDDHVPEIEERTIQLFDEEVKEIESNEVAEDVHKEVTFDTDSVIVPEDVSDINNTIGVEEANTEIAEEEIIEHDEAVIAMPEIFIEKINEKVTGDLFVPLNEVNEQNNSALDSNFEVNGRDTTTIDIVNEEDDDKPKSLNDQLKKGINIGLNDRLAFIKYLFDGSSTDYNRVLSQLNTLNNKDEAIQFITNIVKPDYNNWTGKMEYEDRFIEIVLNKYES